MKTYTVQSAKDAQKQNYGNQSYWDYLETSGKDTSAYYLKQGNKEMAAKMLARSLSEVLAGNDGE